MIKLEGISKTHGQDRLLEEVHFALAKEEKCALVGRNGSGKTTLFRLITGQEEPDAGTILIPKQYRLGYLSQHIHFSKGSVLEEAVLGLLAEQKEELYKAEAILFGLGFTKNDMQKAPSLFSGGYHLRLHLAKLLLSEPDLLLLDEPTNYLDILSIRWLKQFLKAWPKELIMISHERDFLDSVCTHTAAIHRKGIKKCVGTTQKLYEQIATDEQVYEKTRVGIERKRKHLQSFVDRFGAKSSKAAQAQSRVKAIDRLPQLEELLEQENLSFSFTAKETSSKIILKAHDLSFSYSDTPLIRNFSLELEQKGRLAIIGQNGKGKSTLLKLLAKELSPQSGSLQTIQGLHIGYFGQSHINSLDHNLTVEEEIRRVHPQITSEQARSIAGRMLFTQARSEKKIGVLSGGEKSRVLLAKLIATPVSLLLLDEPTNHLDIESMEAFMGALEEFEGAVCFVTHSELMLRRLASELVIFQNGLQAHFLGSYEDFLEKRGWDEEALTAPKKEYSYKEERRQNAERIQERAKALKPYQMKAASLEAKIIALENELQLLNNELLSRFDAAKAKQIKEKQAEIEQLFSELEIVSSHLITLRS